MSDQRGTRRSRRVPTTPSRFEDYDVGQPASPSKKGTISPGNRSPRGSKSSSESASDTSAGRIFTRSKQVTSTSLKEEGARTLRSGSKRQVQQEVVQGETGSSSVKKLKKENDYLEKKQTPSSQAKSSTVRTKTSAPVSGDQREQRAHARSPRCSVNHVDSGTSPESSNLKRVHSPATAKNLNSVEKSSPAELPRNVAIPVKKTSLGTSEGTKLSPASGEVYRVLKKALETRAANDKGSKANQGPMTVTLVEEGSGLKYTIKVLSSAKSSSNTSPDGQSTQAETTALGSQPTQEVLTERSSRNVTPKKNVKVDVIHASTHVSSSDRSTPGLFTSANKTKEEEDEDSSERMTILPTSKGDTSPNDTSKGGTSRRRTSLRSVPMNPKVLNILGGRGHTTYTQTSMKDFRTCLMVNSRDSVECDDKVVRVSTEVVKKSRFRTTDLAAQTKKSQTVSVWDDLNYHILEALGTGQENRNNEYSLAYDLDNSDADKKIQNMLFGQDLDVALTKSQQGIPSNVVVDPQKEKKRKQKNAKITMESWSIALAMMNPDV